MIRTFIYTDEKSNKFWTIEINGNEFTVTYGKVGTAGQTQTKSFADEAACQKEAEKLIKEKTKKGYVEQQCTETVAAAPKKQAAAKSPVSAQKSGYQTQAVAFSCELSNGGLFFKLLVNWGYSPTRFRIDHGAYSGKRYKIVKRYADITNAIADAYKYIYNAMNTKGYTISYIDEILENGDEINISGEQFDKIIEQLSVNGKLPPVAYDPSKAAHRKKVVEAIEKGDIKAIEAFIADGLNLTREVNEKDSENYRWLKPVEIAEQVKQTEMVKYLQTVMARHEKEDEIIDKKIEEVSKKHSDKRNERIKAAEEKEKAEKARLKAEKEKQQSEKAKAFKGTVNKRGAAKSVYTKTIENNEGDYPFTLLGNGCVAVVGHSKHHGQVNVINANTGETQWVAKDNDIWQHNTAPIYDGQHVYTATVRSMSSSRVICAHKPDTGDEAWACSLSTSMEQFGTLMVQTAKHIAVCNKNSKKITMVDKTTGKVACRAKLANGMRGFTPQCELKAWNDKFVVIGVNSRKSAFTLDLYDPATKEGFVKTIATLPDIGRIQTHIVHGDYLYTFTHWGYFFKINLLTGEIEQKEHPDENVYLSHNQKETFHGYNFGTEIFLDGDKLHCVMEMNDEYTLCTYNLASSQFSAKTVNSGQIGKYSVFANNKAYTLSSKQIIVTDLETGNIDEYTTESKIAISYYDGRPWQLYENKIIAVQKSGKNCIIHAWEI